MPPNGGNSSVNCKMLFEDIIMATRRFIGSTWDFESLVGIAYVENEQIITGLLNNNHKEVSILMAQDADANDYHLAVYHVFAGLYLDRILKLQSPCFEVFRFHMDLVTIGHPINYKPYGDLLAQENFGCDTLYLSIERFINQPPLANTDWLLEMLRNNQMNKVFLPTPLQLAPELPIYAPDARPLPHPGLSFGDDDDAVFAEMAEDERNYMSSKRPTYIN